MMNGDVMCKYMMYDDVICKYIWRIYYDVMWKNIYDVWCCDVEVYDVMLNYDVCWSIWYIYDVEVALWFTL